MLVKVLSLLLHGIELLELLIYCRVGWVRDSYPWGLIRLMEGMVEGLMTKLFASLDKRETEGFSGSQKTKAFGDSLLFPPVPSGNSVFENHPRGAAEAAPTRHASLWHFISRALRGGSKMRAKWAADIIINDKQKCDWFPETRGKMTGWRRK